MKKILALTTATFISLGFLIAPTPAFAEDKTCVDTSIIGDGEVCDNNDGASVYHILNLVVDIMSVCIGILGIVGITVVGIQYLTANGNAEKIKKSKRRMLEIVIGIIAYVILYAGLKWLLPQFTGTNP